MYTVNKKYVLYGKISYDIKGGGGVDSHDLRKCSCYFAFLGYWGISILSIELTKTKVNCKMIFNCTFQLHFYSDITPVTVNVFKIPDTTLSKFSIQLKNLTNVLYWIYSG